MNASNADGFRFRTDLILDEAKILLGMENEPEKGPELRIGLKSPLFMAGPARQIGVCRMFSDPCADAYLFSGDERRPLDLDPDGSRYGVCFGTAAGFWARDAEAPAVGIWASSPNEAGILFGGAIAGAVLPAEYGFDAWFSDEPSMPCRLIVETMIWTGYRFSTGKILAAAAVSEEDRGDRGWSARAESDWGDSMLRWNGRVSYASPEWKGLDGDGADPLEARADVSWLFTDSVRVEGRLRAGSTREGEIDWESRTRVTWSANDVTLKAVLEGSDSEIVPFVKLEPEISAEYEGRRIRMQALNAWIFEEGGVQRIQLSSELVLGECGHPRISLEGAYRWTPEEAYWRAGIALETPISEGVYSITIGTKDWSPRSEQPDWEVAFALRARTP